jgi:hypothetical protein
MKQKQKLVAALAITALAAIGSPGNATASTTAGTTILNIVQVDYKDASNTTAFSAAFSTTVTVNLVKAGLSITTPPTAANYTPTFNCLALGNYASGDIFTAYYALTATANGQDNYKLSISNTPVNASSSNATYTLLNADGTVQAGATSAATAKVLNSAIVVGTLGTDTLLFPGGSLKNDLTEGGLVAGDIVVVDYGATKTPYLVKLVTLGNAKGYSINGGTASTTTGSLTNEVQDKVQVEAFVNNSLGFGGAGAAPNFITTAPAIGTVVGQMALVKIDVTAKTNVAGLGNDASVAYQLVATDSADGNVQYVGTGGTNICVAGNFLTTQLSILKQVTNITKGVGPVASTVGDPSDILEYLVTVVNNGGQAAFASVTDNIPPYTKLVTFATGYGVGGTNDTAGYFAEISDGTNIVPLTVDASGEVAAQPVAPAPTVGYGKAAGVTAGSALNFYLGQGASTTGGGTVPSCSDSTKNTVALCPPASWKRTYTIKYRVKVD